MNTSTSNNINESEILLHQQRQQQQQQQKDDEEERRIRQRERNKNHITIRFHRFIASLLVFRHYLITVDTFISCLLTLGLTFYWYFTRRDDTEEWDGDLNFIVFSFAIVTPLIVSIGITFQRRENALVEIAKLRSYAMQLYLANAIWDCQKRNRVQTTTTIATTTKKTENHNSMDIDEMIVENQTLDTFAHSEQVLHTLIHMMKELSRFLTLPCCSKSRHRMLNKERYYAANVYMVSYKLFESFYTEKMYLFAIYGDRLKYMGLAAPECARLHEFTRAMGQAIERLRIIKMYRSPQALRSFGRLFNLILPPIFSPYFAQISLDLNSLSMGILFALLVPLCLTTLFENVQVMEDPFVGNMTLDGIDVREELEIFFFRQLENARKIVFPNFPELSLSFETERSDNGDKNSEQLSDSSSPSRLRQEKMELDSEKNSLPTIEVIYDKNVGSPSSEPSRVSDYAKEINSHATNTHDK